MSTLAEIVKHAREGMSKAVDNTKRELSGIRSGKASPQLLDTIRVEAYGSHVPLNQVAMVSAPEPRLLTVQAYDKGMMQAIEKALRESDIGLNPQSAGTLIRVPLPPLSEERRRELVKVVHKLAEEGRIAVRHARTDAIGKVKKTTGVSEDDQKRSDKEIQKHHDEFIKAIETLVHGKEAELMEV
ncbi:MAG: ribosome recycling factor [Gemmatimonadales bacterium]|nr:ribosome recycling factor [Gemmatimonadales bacterium]